MGRMGLGLVNGVGLSVLYLDSLVLGGAVRGADLFNYAYCLGCIAGYLFLFLFLKNEKRPEKSFKSFAKRIMSFCPLAFAFGVLLLSAKSVFSISASTEFLTGLLVGCSWGLLVCTWLFVYSQYDYSEMRRSIIASWISGCCVFALLAFLSSAAYFGVLITVLLGVGVAGSRCVEASSSGASNDRSGSLLPEGRRFVLDVRYIAVAAAAIGLVSGVSGSAFLNSGEGFYIAGESIVNHLIAESISVLIAVFVVLVVKRSDVSMLFLVAVAAEVTVAIFLSFMDLWYVNVFNSIASVMSKTVDKLLFLVCASVGIRSTFFEVAPPLLASSRVGVTLGVFLGQNIYTFLNDQSKALMGVTITVLYLAFLALSILLVIKGRGSKLSRAKGDQLCLLTSMDDDRQKVISSLAGQYGLTQRESQVLDLLAKGRSATFIAKELYLSANTVKSYSKNIYSKLDVHSKQELIDLFEERNKAEFP